MAKKFYDGETVLKVMANGLTEEAVDAVAGDYEIAAMKRVFDDKELLETCFCLFENDLNISRAARELYMHRNTLIYRVNKVKTLINLNVCLFKDAVKFLALYEIYKRTSAPYKGE